MAAIDSRKISRIGQRYKDIVFGYINRVQILLPTDSPYFNIVDLIKHLCLLYYYPVIESSILNEEQSSDFLKLLQQNHKYLCEKEWKLIYKATLEDINPDICVEHVYDKPNLICLFYGVRGNICGGYTSTGWSMKYHDKEQPTEDMEAFVFSIKSKNEYKPLLLNIKSNQTKFALRYSRRQYCVFGGIGGNFTLFLEKENIYCNNTSNFESYPSTYYLLGGQHGEKVQMVEFFQLT